MPRGLKAATNQRPGASGKAPSARRLTPAASSGAQAAWLLTLAAGSEARSVRRLTPAASSEARSVRRLTPTASREARSARRLTSVAGLLAIVVLLSGAAQAAIFPDHLGTFQKSSPKTIGIPDKELYDEYGLEATESAEYASPDKKRFSATAWRLHDSTGALALFDSRRPPGAVPSDFAQLAVRTSDGIIFVFGNYVFQFTGTIPDQPTLNELYSQLARVENAPLPALSTFLPQDGLVANSERYILGPVSLQRVEPGIPPSVAAFHLGAEAQFGEYQTPKGLLKLIIFDYPTPSMAREQAVEFQKIPGAVVKRTGPLVVATVNPPDADAAERILSKINYQANVTLNEPTPQSQAKGLARMILNIFVLAGIVLAFCVVGGLGFAGYRIMSRKMWRKEEFAEMIVLGLGKNTGGK
jgi:hypothetical protein